MSKVSIVYWSGTGNTAMMAGSIADGVAAAGGEAELIMVDQASVDALKDASVIALGCPSMVQSSWKRHRWSHLCVSLMA